MMIRFVAVALAASSLTESFITTPKLPQFHSVYCQQGAGRIQHSLLFQRVQKVLRNDCDEEPPNLFPFRSLLSCLDMVESAGLEDVKFSGVNDLKSARLKDLKLAGIVKFIKSLHNPITYLALALLAGSRWSWCFRNPYYWFGVAFCVKWYRARYVFKIPVWDRQPNWNNIITSREQEKDLKAFTCKTCGSTLFIAKTREFFFEGDTGIGGLGCFSCGAKGKDNFVMDRDRIVEDVEDMDDYFDYERPLDFVSAAERRKLMKEAGGDEEKANQILLNRASAQTDSSVIEAKKTEEKVGKDDNSDLPVNGESISDGNRPEATSDDALGRDSTDDSDSSTTSDKAKNYGSNNSSSGIKKDAPESTGPNELTKAESNLSLEKPKVKKSKKKKTVGKKSAPEPPSDNLDALGMDDF